MPQLEHTRCILVLTIMESTKCHSESRKGWKKKKRKEKTGHDYDTVVVDFDFGDRAMKPTITHYKNRGERESTSALLAVLIIRRG